MVETDEQDFGELDGEQIEAVVIEVKGSGQMDRLLEDDERIILVVEGAASFKSVERVNGRLVKKYVLKANRIAEPVDNLLAETESFLQMMADEAAGAAPLPFDPDTGEMLPPEEPKEDED